MQPTGSQVSIQLICKHISTSKVLGGCHGFSFTLFDVRFFSTTIRLGEAAVPGPHVFASANATGLLGKSAALAALCEHSATFAVQETHLTAQGIGRFKKELTWQNTKFNLTHGAPAPPKNQSLRTLGGMQTGVGFVSHYPIRSLVHHWSAEDYATGRCLATAAYVNQRWVTMGTVFGHVEGAYSQKGNRTLIASCKASLLGSSRPANDLRRLEPGTISVAAG